MIAGGPAMGAVGHEAFTPELAPRGDRLGPPGDRWPFPGIPFGPAESFGGA
jgi:hypothetical protein